MESFVLRKRRRVSEEEEQNAAEEESTDFKLILLISLHPDVDQGVLLEALLASDGSVEDANQLLSNQETAEAIASPKKPRLSVPGHQASLASFNVTYDASSRSGKRPLTKRGKTLHLYTPESIEEHTPCSIIHNFLPTDEADALLRELLNETPTFRRLKFKLFDRVVESPHTACFYVNSLDEAEKQKTEYVYNGSRVDDVRKGLPEMLKVSLRVQDVVNAEVQRRIAERYPNGKKLIYQSPDEWIPNCSFVNCYDGAQESVGYHSDQLTYLGPRAIIGSISLGVTREFRVRRVVGRDDETDDGEPKTASSTSRQSIDRADTEGQIAIHLPHNSLLVMHAEMQEDWKHSIAPAQVIDPHPIAGNKRINITYRHYKEWFHPKYTVRCKCGIPCVLRCVQRKRGNKGRYMWMCYSHYTPGNEGCGFFQWAEFDEDGNPPWATKLRLNTFTALEAGAQEGSGVEK